MAADTTVKYFHSAMTGAPALSGSAGALLAVLNATQVDGFGSVTLDSLVVNNGIATATRGAGLSFELGTVVLVEGAALSALNGEKRVLSVTATTLTFDAAGVSNQTAGGAITLKMAPAGWGRLFTGTNIAAYQSLNPVANGCVLRVDDTGTTTCRVVGYESMSDINTGVNAFPTTAQASGGGYWPKSDAASTAARPWIVISDSRFFILATAHVASAATSYSVQCFGEGAAFAPIDAYAGVLACSSIVPTIGIAGGANGTNMFSPRAGGEIYLQRNYAGAVSQLGSILPAGGGTSSYPSGSNNFSAYPSPIHGQVIATNMWVGDTALSSTDIRHVLPGCVHFQANLGTTYFPSKTKITAGGVLAGKTVYTIATGGNTGPNRGGVDITGPWR